MSERQRHLGPPGSGELLQPVPAVLTWFRSRCSCEGAGRRVFKRLRPYAPHMVFIDPHPSYTPLRTRTVTLASPCADVEGMMECWRVNLWFPGSCSSFIRSGCDNTPTYKHRSESKTAFLEEAISESRTLPGRPLRVAPCRAYFKPFNIFPPTPAGNVDIGWEAFMKAYELPSITARLHVCGGKSQPL